MTIEHSIITDPNIHEPKGITTALNRQVYTANGASSGAWESNLPNNTVVVNSVGDFPTPSGGEIQLVDNTTYVLGADITTADSIRLGVRNTITGGAVLKSTNVNGLFLGGDFQVALLRDLRIACSTGPLFTLTDTVPGTSILSLTGFECLEYDTIGVFTDILGVQMVSGQFNDPVNSTDGMLFVGSNFSVISLQELTFVTQTGAGYIAIDLGTATTSGTEIANIAVIGIAGTVAINGAATSANIPAGILANISSSNLAPGAGTALTGITEDDVRWNFTANSGITDTYPDGLLSMVGNATVTTISAVDTPTLVAGTFTTEGLSQFVGTAAGRLTYIGERPLRSPIHASIALEPVSGTNKDLRVYIAINGTVVTNSGKTVRASNASPLAITVIWQETLVENDFIEIFVENTTDAVNITVPDAVLRLR